MIKMQFSWYMRWSTGVFFINLLAGKKQENVGHFQIELLFTDLELERNENLMFEIKV